MSILEVHHLTVNYEKAAALWDITFDIPDPRDGKGHLVGIIGPNGAGKSTFLKALLGIVQKRSGMIRFFGGKEPNPQKKIAYIPQKGEIDWDFPITAYEVVLMGALPKAFFFGWPSKKSRIMAYEMLDKVGMKNFASRQISQLSGGQQQRLFIARALMQEADLYLMDEPFAGVDATTEREIFTLFHELQEKGKTLLIVHHDLSTVDKYFDWVIILNICLVAAGPREGTFTQEILSKAYGKNAALLDEAIQRGQRQKMGSS